MSNEAELWLAQQLRNLQQHPKLRRMCAILLFAGLCVSTIWFLLDALPRQYRLSIAGSEIVSNRHFLGKALQQESSEQHIQLRIVHVENSEQALQWLEQGKLDLAFIQAGMPRHYKNVVHVATVEPELLHLLVKPDIRNFADLRAHLVNLGNAQSETRLIAQQILEYSGLQAGVDYVESNYGDEELMGMRSTKLPDAIMLTSYLPSMMVDFLVRQRNYHLLEIPYATALALHNDWAESRNILAQTYRSNPAVPERDIATVGIHLHLLANQKVDDKAIFQILKSLYAPGFAARMKLKFEENKLALPSGYPLAQGAKHFLERNSPLVSSENFEKLKAMLGLVLSLVSSCIVVLRWLRGTSV